jgi:hypothetical protein
MKFTLVSGCSTQLDIDTLNLNTVNVKYVEQDVTRPTLAQVFDSLNSISNYVPRPSTSYIILNLVETSQGKEQDYLIVGRVQGEDSLSITPKMLLKRTSGHYEIVDGTKLDIRSIDNITII